MRNFKIFLILPTMLLFFAACTDLEENLVGDITEDINIEGISTGDDQGGSDILGGAFAELRNSGTAFHSSYYSVNEIVSDEMVIAAKGGDWFDGGILVQLHQHTYTPVHSFITNAWNGSYNAINTCNELIANPALDNSQISQVRALRAYFYYRLCDMYGNVKLITSPGMDEVQSDRAAVFAFVESELLDVLGVADVSAGFDPSGSALGTDVNPFRINLYGALGILSKLYLNAEAFVGTAMYDKAALAAGYVIDNGPYQLCDAGCSVSNLGKRPAVDTDPDELSGYAAVFAPNNDNNPEHIFVVEYDEVSATGMNFSQMNLHYSSQFTWNFDAQPWNGYATLEEFYNSYESGDLRREASFIVGPQLDFGGSAVLDYASDDDDIQLSYTPAINELTPNSLREAGARPGKFSFKQLGRPEMNNDYPIIRLGEMYLTRAEGLARAAGDWSLALPDVNEIRARAGVAAFGAIDADEFLAERGREMFQEASRRTDLIRFGKFNDAWWEKPASPAHVSLFPIPQDAIDASATGNPLTQNPGY
ncbi:MAG: RagB/SusD family nutrient uptake outer membrane protein [Saprospiraceae bacterium]|nr:RagB/SusD family nutrient uptake outer membrane protein [Saprospiraceae bacterium]